MTFLEIVNEVLIKLREPTVSSVTQTAYAKLIAAFVNDAKRVVEDAWNWDALNASIPVITTPGTTNYVVVGSGIHFKDVVINDTTNRGNLINVPYKWIQNQQQVSQVQNGQPTYFTWKGNDGTDSKIELYPTPDGTYTLMVNLKAAQAKLVDGADILSIPPEPVIAHAYARGLVERGEDGGLTSSEAYAMYKLVLADHIAIESGRYVENDCWVAN